MDIKKLLYLLVIFFVAMLGMLAGFAIGAFSTYQILDGQTLDIAAETVEVSTPEVTEQTIEVVPPHQLFYSNTEIETTITQAVEKAGAAVVTVIGTIPGYSNWPYQVSDQQASGSGIIISEDGYILTNNHVVENMSDIQMILADGTELQAVIVEYGCVCRPGCVKSRGDDAGCCSSGRF